MYQLKYVEYKKKYLHMKKIYNQKSGAAEAGSECGCGYCAPPRDMPRDETQQWSSDHPLMITITNSALLGNILNWNIQLGKPSQSHLTTKCRLRRKYMAFQFNIIRQAIEQSQFHPINIIMLQECDHGLLFDLAGSVKEEFQLEGFSVFVNSQHQDKKLPELNYGSYGNVTFIRSEAFLMTSLTSDYAIGTYERSVPRSYQYQSFETIPNIRKNTKNIANPSYREIRGKGFIISPPKYFSSIKHPSQKTIHNKTIRNGIGPFTIYFDNEGKRQGKRVFPEPDKNMALDVRIVLQDHSQVIVRNVHTYMRGAHTALSPFHFAIKPSLHDRHIILGGDFNMSVPTMMLKINGTLGGQPSLSQQIEKINHEIDRIHPGQPKSDFTIPYMNILGSPLPDRHQKTIKNGVDAICLLSLPDKGELNIPKFKLFETYLYPDNVNVFYKLPKSSASKDARVKRKSQTTIRSIIERNQTLCSFEPTGDNIITIIPNDPEHMKLYQLFDYNQKIAATQKNIVAPLTPISPEVIELLKIRLQTLEKEKSELEATIDQTKMIYH